MLFHLLYCRSCCLWYISRRILSRLCHLSLFPCCEGYRGYCEYKDRYHDNRYRLLYFNHLPSEKVLVLIVTLNYEELMNKF
jgi:hypothetical protein